ncbi:DUF397 domain-containing protein [Actinoplanes sp. KI2]|uniref:DUF397 domain-containing protein n=1 Tax=Actinoplanes sp. KI2 TaxID=2983315 RepID=UPI00398364BD
MDNEFENMSWQSSSACSGGHCVEVAFAGSWVVLRNSKYVAGPVVICTRSAWEEFRLGVLNDEFDLC